MRSFLKNIRTLAHIAPYKVWHKPTFWFNVVKASWDQR